jgi:hypothetical protein
MANYGDFRAVLEQIAKHLRRIEDNTRDCCVGAIKASTSNFLPTPAVTTAVLYINNVSIGTGVNAAYADLTALVTALDAEYSGLADFELNADNSITVISNNPGSLKLVVESV